MAINHQMMSILHCTREVCTLPKGKHPIIVSLVNLSDKILTFPGKPNWCDTRDPNQWYTRKPNLLMAYPIFNRCNGFTRIGFILYSSSGSFYGTTLSDFGNKFSKGTPRWFIVWRTHPIKNGSTSSGWQAWNRILRLRGNLIITYQVLTFQVKREDKDGRRALEETRKNRGGVDESSSGQGEEKGK